MRYWSPSAGPNFTPFICALVVCTLFGSTSVADEPYRPRDTDVVETLPATGLLSRDQIAMARQKLAEDPKNLKLAAGAAIGYLQMGKATGDPRYYGYAKSAIKPWDGDTVAPAEIIKVRAKLFEKEHAYGKAITELESLVNRQPHDAQAWIELASLYRVKGHYAKAWKACESLDEFANPMQSAICRIPLMAVNGKAKEAIQLLNTQQRQAAEKMPALLHWFSMMKADVYRIQGETDKAVESFQAALAHAPDGTYLKRAYAEFLLDQGQPADAMELLRSQIHDNGSLLLATIAAQRSGNLEYARQWQSRLESRYAEIRLRGSEPHGRFESRYELELNNQPAQALKLALETWELQKEARDMRNVLEAAVATKQPEAAEPVLQFMRESGTEDVELLKLAAKLEQQ